MKRVAILAVSLAVWTGVAGCEFFRSAPELRAVEYIGLLVKSPDERERLAGLALAPDAGGRDPADMIEGLSVRVAIDYLRAEQRLGARLDFSINTVVAPAPGTRRVTVRVSHIGPGPGEGRPMYFDVLLREQAPRDWRVERINAGSGP